MNHQENKTIVGNRIRQIRKALNLKGKEFAPRLNISGPSLSDLEKGKYYPNFEFLINISREFNVNLDYLIFGEGDMFMSPGSRTDFGLLKELINSSGIVSKFITYFERSGIMRFFLLSKFKEKIILEKEIIDKEIAEFKE